MPWRRYALSQCFWFHYFIRPTGLLDACSPVLPVSTPEVRCAHVRCRGCPPMSTTSATSRRRFPAGGRSSHAAVLMVVDVEVHVFQERLRVRRIVLSGRRFAAARRSGGHGHPDGLGPVFARPVPHLALVTSSAPDGRLRAQICRSTVKQPLKVGLI